MGPEDGYGLLPTYLDGIEQTEEELNDKILYEEHVWEEKTGR